MLPNIQIATFTHYKGGTCRSILPEPRFGGELSCTWHIQLRFRDDQCFKSI